MFIFSDFILFQLHDPPLLSLTSPPSPYSARHSMEQVLLSCNITAFPAPEVIVWHFCWEGRMQEKKIKCPDGRNFVLVHTFILSCRIWKQFNGLKLAFMSVFFSFVFLSFFLISIPSMALLQNRGN